MHGGPVWRSMVAPALAWASAVWQTTTKPALAFFTISELRNMWLAVPKDGLTWKNSRGPISRMFVSLQRIGWEALGPLLWKDGKGNELPLLCNSPAMLGALLCEGVQRHRERSLATKLGWGERVARVR
eukprot:8713348-Pyramimonas_sp.AAC.1